MDVAGLEPSGPLLVSAALLDAIFGDPRYPFHPIRLMGSTLAGFERLLRRFSLDGYGGGCVLFLLLSVIWVALPSFLVAKLYAWRPEAGIASHLLLAYTLLALRDLIDHVRNVQRAARKEDLPAARQAIGLMVGRDTSELDFAACRRAAIESLAENFVDGFLSPVCWCAVLGLPGLLLFKVVSTMDSMVGYKTTPYRRFGWCGARLDDFMNYVPARLSWVLLALSASFHRGLSPLKGLRIGLEHHAVLPGPNAGWSEATMAGLLQRRLIGPIRKDGTYITTVWIGHPADPEGGKDRDVTQAIWAVITASLLTSVGLLAILR